ncbi:MAG: SWIM zinc finger family protein, partial [Arcobacteraceae bacterium]
MQITKEDIKKNVELSAYNSGYHYFKDGDVEEYEIFEESDELVSLNSFVKGLKQYEQDIDISYKNKKLQIIGNCSCSSKENCKHVVAVCLQYISDKKSENPTNKYDKWLNSLTIVSTKKQFELYQTEPFIIYRLFAEDTRT